MPSTLVSCVDHTPCGAFLATGKYLSTASLPWGATAGHPEWKELVKIW